VADALQLKHAGACRQGGGVAQFWQINAQEKQEAAHASTRAAE